METKTDLKKLHDLLKTHPLDPKWEKAGNFYQRDVNYYAPSAGWQYIIFGNFLDISFGFEVRGMPHELQTTLDLIRANQRSDAYRRARQN